MHPLSKILVVLIVPPKPWLSFVTPFRLFPVKPLVHSLEGIQAASIGGVRVVDGAIGECERDHAWSLAGVSEHVSAGIAANSLALSSSS
jgi:hypothetical protein